MSHDGECYVYYKCCKDFLKYDFSVFHIKYSYNNGGFHSKYYHIDTYDNLSKYVVPKILNYFPDPLHTGYPLRKFLITPFKGTNEWCEWNMSISALRLCVEWGFQKTFKIFSFWIIKKSKNKQAKGSQFLQNRHYTRNQSEVTQELQ